MRPGSLGSLIVALIAGSLLCVTSAQAQQVKKGELSGTILSGGVSVPASSSLVVFTAPATGNFILTTFCARDVALSGNTVGPIAPADSDEPCLVFVPGFAIPSGEVLTCTNDEVDPGICSVSGVLSKK